MERFKINNSEIDTLVSRFNELKDEIDSLTKEQTEISSRIKEISTNEYLEIYEGNGFISSVILETDNIELEFSPKDQYLKIDESKSEYLNSIYGDITDITYTVDNSLLNKHINTIEEALSDVIPSKDYEKLLKKSYNVKKGTIKNMSQYTNDYKQLYNDIQVVSTIKNIKTK